MVQTVEATENIYITKLAVSSTETPVVALGAKVGKVAIICGKSVFQAYVAHKTSPSRLKPCHQATPSNEVMASSPFRRGFNETFFLKYNNYCKTLH